MLCCSNYQLPDDVRALLFKYPNLSQFTYFFKNAEYLVLSMTDKDDFYFVQLVDEQRYNVQGARLYLGVGILVMGKTFVGEKPELVAEQIYECMNSMELTELPIYPVGYTNMDINAVTLDVGVGVYPWPERYFAPYVDITAWPTYQIADMAEVTGVRYYNLGFIVAQSATNSTPTWGTYYPLEEIPGLDQIKKLRDMGGDITVSFGGAANVPIHVAAGGPTSLMQSYRKVINTYSLRRIDLDIEGAWLENDEANLRNALALRILQDDFATVGYEYDVWLTLPVLREGLTPAGLRIIATMVERGVDLAGVNIMTMDYGPPYPDMGQAAIDACEALHGQLADFYPDKTDEELWQMIGATPMIGKNDIEGEVFYIDDAKLLANYFKNPSKPIAEISMWSSNRDNTQASGVPQDDNEFSTTFVGLVP